MRYDVVIVTYNSAKWLDSCISALRVSAGDSLKQLNLIFVDNCSTDATIARLEELKTKYSSFGGFTILPQTQNLGFSAGCNLGAKAGKAPYIFFLNADTEVSPALFKNLTAAIEAADSDIAAFECRQLPFETGHHINPVTLETSWASGAALVVQRDAFEEVGGFDEHLFMYCEDVDLSWMLRAAGHRLQYAPSAGVVHYSYKEKADGSTEEKLSEYAGSFLGNLLLRYKYGSIREILQGHKMYLGALRRPQHFANVRKVLAKNYIKHFVQLWPFLAWRGKHKAWFRAKPANFTGGFSADRGHFKLQNTKSTPLVTIIGPASPTLPCTQQSLQNQTYTNHEALVLKQQTTECMLHTLLQAKGEYVVFYGEYQYFYPDCLEMLVATAEANPAKDWVSAAYLSGSSASGPYAFRLENQGPLPLQSFLWKRSFVIKQLEKTQPGTLATAMDCLLSPTIASQQQMPDIPRALTLQYLA